MNNLLRVNDLHTYFHLRSGVVKAVEGVSLEIEKGEVVGIVGESGCGKSVTALSIIRLIQAPGKIERGEVLFKGTDLVKMEEKDLRKLRGSEISMIFQEPMTALNPVFTVGYQIEEVLKLHTNLGKKERRERVLEMMKKVGLPDPEKRYREYPHQLSGGMRQRIMIAMALIMNPSLVIADEPTTALDVTIQRQILDLMKNLKNEYDMSLLFITHDMGVVREISDKVYVMYAGKVVEYGKMNEIFENPLHPYTKGLLDSIPSVDIGERKKPLKSIEGNVPDPARKPSGCPFHPRCDRAMEICGVEEPPLIKISETHSVRCHLYG